MNKYKIIRNVGLVGLLASTISVSYYGLSEETLHPSTRISRFYEIPNELHHITGYDFIGDPKLEDKCSALIKEWTELNSNQELLKEKEDFEKKRNVIRNYYSKRNIWKILLAYASLAVFIFGQSKVYKQEHNQ